MATFMGELLGTLILILLGDGVVANVLLTGSKGEKGGFGGGAWIVITTGWGLAVAMAVYATGWVSGAHINPAVTVGLAAAGIVSWGIVVPYIIAQMIGAFIGAVLVWLTYYQHYEATDNPDFKLLTFCTMPAIRNYLWNFITEVIGTMMLLWGVVFIFVTNPQAGNFDINNMAPYLVGFLVFAIGLSLGGPTGYAINPARDLGPRIAHFVLPIPGKRDSDWGYSWIPVIGPLVGGIIGGVTWALIFAPMMGFGG
jgi:glycerol uptake facilitator protein